MRFSIFYYLHFSNTCNVRRVIECAYCIRIALLIKTIAIEAIPYDTAANKLCRNEKKKKKRRSLVEYIFTISNCNIMQLISKSSKCIKACSLQISKNSETKWKMKFLIQVVTKKWKTWKRNLFLHRHGCPWPRNSENEIRSKPIL